MKKKIPKRILIFGKWVKIKRVKKLKKGRMADTNGNTIQILKSVKPREAIGIILHEAWHCYIRRVGIFQTDHCPQIEEIEADGIQSLILENLDFSFKKENF